MIAATGWAVVVDGDIDVRSVSSTMNAAMVNWLVAARGIAITNGMSDESVAQAFERARFLAPHKIELSVVTIEVR